MYTGSALRLDRSSVKLTTYLDKQFPLPKFDEHHLELLNGPLTLDELKLALDSMPKNKAPGRFASDNIRRLLHIIHRSGSYPASSAVISLDAEKAFDRIEWSFLWAVLDHVEAGQGFIKMVKSLYNCCSARVLTGSLASSSFPLGRGTRQGCPLSPLLFTLSVEPLAQAFGLIIAKTLTDTVCRMTSNTTLSLSKITMHFERTTLDSVFYTIVVLLGTTGNSMVIWVAGFRMKPTVTNVWLVNLAVADLIFCLTQVMSVIKSIFYDYWPFGLFLCKFNGFFKYANMFCSVFLLAVISVDRVLCICHPVFTRKRRTLCAARVVSVGVWIVAVMFSSPYFVYRQIYLGKNNLSRCSFKEKEIEGGISSKYIYYCTRFLCGFLLPFLVILICYIVAGVGIRRTRLSGKSRPLRVLAVLVCAFFLCWAPYHFLGLVKLVNKDNKAVREGWGKASNLAYFNSCVNPVLYFCMGLDLSRRCNQSLSGIFRRALIEEGQSFSRQGTREKSSNSFQKTEDIECETKV
ncbi:hypothetical protein QQF64_013340 [Cirrhinus molitorella]|uniref:G-protein coupled receptors family 1 profile domain-containing protein n=1 Tax=Cirrhinus molitorella TaxID=172907 RepID=A0ABR3LU57_9TELE